MSVRFIRLTLNVFAFWLVLQNTPQLVFAVELKATSSSYAYSVINKFLAPEGNAVETPDCAHKEFGPHITQLFDRTLNRYVFRFHVHRDFDNDRCKKDDRQRIEIKVYAKSPEFLKAVSGDVYIYRWKFRLSSEFRPSRRFTHLHQIKAVGGIEARMPLITLTARKGRKGAPNRFELRYANKLTSRILYWKQLKPFLGKWIKVIEKITYGEKGKYSVEIKSIKTNKIMFFYRNNKIPMWKNGAEFLRPKWGIYRSLKDKINLRDEVVDFADFSIIYR